MNTIPSTFNEYQIQYTVLGGTEDVPSVKLPIAVILLNTGIGGLYRAKILDNLIKNGFCSIVSIDKTDDNYNIEDFARLSPCVKFIVPHTPVSVGDMINLGMAEVEAENVLVINDSIHINSMLISHNIIEKYVNGKNVCLVPRLVNAQRQQLPVRFSPIVENAVLKAMPSALISDGVPTLYPFDFVGIYNKERFIKLGGFDHTITTPYWQKMDFFVRAWLWGDSVLMTPLFQLAYDDVVSVENSTPDKSHLRFFLKNCAPKFAGNRCYIPISKFFQYKNRSGSTFSEAYKHFREARRWVEKNKYRFKQDVSMLLTSWGEAIK